MRKWLFILILFVSTVSSTINAQTNEVVNITSKAQYQSLVAKGPVLLYLSLDCSIGSNAVRKFHTNFKDFSGVILAAVNINNLYKYASYRDIRTKTGLGAILAIINGKAVASTEETNLIGLNNMRAWAAGVLKRKGINFSYKKLDFGRANPDLTSGNVNLNEGLIALFRFNGNTNDESGNNNIFTVTPDSKIYNNMLYSNGYNFKKYSSPSARIRNLDPSKAFTVSLNLKQKKVEKSKYLNWCILFEIKYRLFTVINYKGKLIVNFDFYWKENGKYKSYGEFYIFEETNIPFNKWQHIVFSFNPDNRRISVMLNGKRLKDFVVSTKAINMFREKFTSSPYGRGLQFHRGGAPGGFFGEADDIAVYNRELNNSEMSALYRRYSKNLTGDANSITPEQRTGTGNQTGRPGENSNNSRSTGRNDDTWQ